MAFTMHMASAFEVLGEASEDSEPENILEKIRKTREEEKAEKEKQKKEKAKQLKREKAQKEKNAKKAETETPTEAAKPQTNNTMTGNARGNARGMGPRNMNRSQVVQQPFQSHREGVEVKRGGGGGGSAGPRRGGFGGRGRQFERHSGSDRTGIKAMDKREGSGPHNWGNATDEVQAEAPVPEETENVPEDSANAENEEVAAGPQEPAYMSIKDYQAQEENRKKALKEQLEAQKAKRKANDGETNAFANMTLYRKANDVPESDQDSDDEDIAKRNTLKIDLRYSGRINETTARGSRGGRGRGGQHRQQGRGGKFATASLALDNDKDFPELGTAPIGKHV